MILSIVLGLSLGCQRDWKLVIGWLGVRWGLIHCVLLVPLTGESFFLLYLIPILAPSGLTGMVVKRRTSESELISDSKDLQSHGPQAATPPTP